MKTRLGFVSNSSSSSYLIVYSDDAPTIQKIEEMNSNREQNYQEPETDMYVLDRDYAIEYAKNVLSQYQYDIKDVAIEETKKELDKTINEWEEAIKIIETGRYPLGYKIGKLAFNLHGTQFTKDFSKDVKEGKIIVLGGPELE